MNINPPTETWPRPLEPPRVWDDARSRSAVSTASWTSVVWLLGLAGITAAYSYLLAAIASLGTPMTTSVVALVAAPALVGVLAATMGLLTARALARSAARIETLRSVPGWAIGVVAAVPGGGMAGGVVIMAYQAAKHHGV